MGDERFIIAQTDLKDERGDDLAENGDAPHVSVIILTYNRAPVLGRAIKSVFGQSYQDFELIVVDGCSTDNTEEIVKSFEDERIKYIKQGANRGISDARNIGIRSSKGDYIGFLDDDDEWLPNKLEMQVDLLDRLPEDYGVVYSGCRTEQDGKIVGEYYPAYQGDVYYQMLRQGFIGTSTILIKRSCFRVAGFFDEELPSCEDWDMWIRLAKDYKFEYVPDILAVYHIHGNQMTFDHLKFIIGTKGVLNKYHEDFSRNRIILSEQYRYLGALYYLTGDKAEGTRFMFKSIKLNPLQNGIVHVFAALLIPNIYKDKMLMALTGYQNAKTRQHVTP